MIGKIGVVCTYYIVAFTAELKDAEICILYDVFAVYLRTPGNKLWIDRFKLTVVFSYVQYEIIGAERIFNVEVLFKRD